MVRSAHDEFSVVNDTEFSQTVIRVLHDRSGGGLRLPTIARLGGEAITDTEVGVDVLPLRSGLLEFLTQLADEDINRPVTVGHCVAPDTLVDLLTLEHAALRVGKQLDQFELTTGQLS